MYLNRLVKNRLFRSSLLCLKALMLCLFTAQIFIAQASWANTPSTNTPSTNAPSTNNSYHLVDLPPASPSSPHYATGPHIEVHLLSNKNALVPGDTIELGVLFQPEKLWHTYWRNPGDSGEAPTIKWTTNLDSAAQLSFGDIQWPFPTPIQVAHLVNYGYEGANLLIVPVNIPDNIRNVPAHSSTDAASTSLFTEVVISADVSWLVCKEDCIPGWATLTLTLPIADLATMTANASLFAQTKTYLPSKQIKSGAFEILEDAIAFEIIDVEQKDWQVFPFRSDLVQHAGPQSLVHSFENETSTTRIIAPRGDYFDGKANSLSWLISDGSNGYYVEGLINKPNTAHTQTIELASTIQTADIAIFMLMAFTGGLILNLMPCVLPILSIKALALQSNEEAKSAKFAYLAGILTCFNLFAIIIILLQQSGNQVGWGFHMQEPIVVVALAFLFTLIALVLLDALALSSKLSNIGQSLVAGNSNSAHFATGALAVIVASPCTAPFMAAALGVALVSEPFITMLIFNALALGFALPLTLLFMSKKAMKLLPKPGAWMETFKHMLAFPMLATVAWLSWVFAGQAGSQAQFVLLLCLTFFCMFSWLLGQTKRSGFKVMNIAGILLCLVIPLMLSRSNMVDVNKAQSARQNASTYSAEDTSIAYSPVRLASLRSSNEVVVVNMTADWCITCKVNEQIALSSNAVLQALNQEGVHYMVGDWTNKNTEIFNYLSQYGRAGVPLYVVYAGEHSHQVLPQILTPNAVIDAINTAKEEL